MRTSFYTLKSLDRTLGRLAATILPLPSPPATQSSAKILLIRPGGIGDAVLLAPAIAALQNKFPQAEITVLAEKRNAGVFALIPGLRRVLCYDKPQELLTALRLKPDLAIDTEQYHRLSAVVARLTGAKTLIGFGTNERARLFHHAIAYSHDNYEAESFCHLLAPLAIKPPSAFDAPFLTVPEEADTRVGQLLSPLAGRPFISIFPGASIAERRWDTERFAQAARTLAWNGHPSVVVGGTADAGAGEAIAAAGDGINLAGQTSLAETAAILARSALLISGDSGVLHLAVGLGTPTVSLFGPGIADKWAPRGARHIVLNHHLPCSPCTKFGYTPKCPHDAECMRKISTDDVVHAALALL